MSFVSNFEEYLREQSEMGRLYEIGDASHPPYNYVTLKASSYGTPPNYASYQFTTPTGFLYTVDIFCTGDQMEIDFTANGSVITIQTTAAEQRYI